MRGAARWRGFRDIHYLTSRPAEQTERVVGAVWPVGTQAPGRATTRPTPGRRGARPLFNLHIVRAPSGDVGPSGRSRGGISSGRRLRSGAAGERPGAMAIGGRGSRTGRLLLLLLRGTPERRERLSNPQSGPPGEEILALSLQASVLAQELVQDGVLFGHSLTGEVNELATLVDRASQSGDFWR